MKSILFAIIAILAVSCTKTIEVVKPAEPTPVNKWKLCNCTIKKIVIDMPTDTTRTPSKN